MRTTTSSETPDDLKFSDDAPRGEAELIFDRDHLQRVVIDGMLKAEASLEITTADLKAMLVPASSSVRSAPSIVNHLCRLAERGVEIRLLHAGIPSSAAIAELRKLNKRKGGRGGMPRSLTLRRCPRLHMKTVIIDGRAMYLGSANLTGAGLGAKSEHRRNFEAGLWTRSAVMIDAVLERFNRLWEGEACVNCDRHDICPVPLEEPKL